MCLYTDIVPGSFFVSSHLSSTRFFKIIIVALTPSAVTRQAKSFSTFNRANAELPFMGLTGIIRAVCC